MPSWCPVWTTATRYSLELQSLSRTSYSESSMRQHVLLAALESTIVAWRHSSMPIYTGLMFQIEWHTSSACWCTSVCKARLQNTSSTAARPSLTSSAARHTDTGSPHSAVGPSLLWVPRSGTRCQTTSELNRTVSQWLFLSAPKDFPFLSLLAYSEH